MEKAKAAISDFMGRAGHHDTSVHETVAPAVEHETVKPHQHENINTAVDKEVHQDHYHRTVQPVQDREVLPETHETRLGAVQHREHDHRDHDHTKSALAQDQAQFQNERVVEPTTASRSVAPTVGGEHVHHHIHETIQPVVHKETVQPNVVHTTVPIHEVHHNKATHHDTTSLPPMTMDQFKSQGGSLTGREERYDEFQGVPKNLGSGTAGGLGTVRGMEHQSGQHSGLTHNTTTPGIQGVTGSTGTGGMTGHHGHHGHHDYQHADRGLTDSSTTGGVAGHQDNHHHSSTAGGVAGGVASGMAGHHDKSHHHDHATTGSSGIAGMAGATGSATSGGLSSHDQHQHADRGMEGQGNMTGSSTQGGVVSHDRDNTVSTADRHSGTGRHTDGVVEGVASHGENELAHRENESGELPKALTEERSKAVPHSSLTDDQHSTGHHSHENTTGGHGHGNHKPGGVADKLDPKTDSNNDGVAGMGK